jgi:hypothetical protein
MSKPRLYYANTNGDQDVYLAVHREGIALGAEDEAIVEGLTVGGDGVIAMAEGSTPAASTGWGKLFPDTSGNILFRSGQSPSVVYSLAGPSHNVYGAISVENNATATVISTPGTFVQVTVFDTNEASNVATPDHTQDHVTVPQTGVYFICVPMTLDSVAGAGSKAEARVAINNGTTFLSGIHCDRNLGGGGGASGALPMSGPVALTAGDTVEVWIANLTNTANYIVQNCNLYVQLISARIP